MYYWKFCSQKLLTNGLKKCFQKYIFQLIITLFLMITNHSSISNINCNSSTNYNRSNHNALNASFNYGNENRK